MKSRLLNVGLIACALLMTLSGCSTDETATDGKGTEAQSMKITVSEGNFTSADNSAAKTRATDTESGTSFTSGDAIGVFVVKSDGNLVLANAKYTYNGSKWLNSSNNEDLLYYEGAKYFAYYPYQENSYMTTDKYDATKTTAATDFFATLISGWTPTTDQSTQDLYTAQDLMVSMASVDADSHGCTFAMAHQMSMIEMDLHQAHYTYNGADTYRFTFGDTYKPFNMAAGKYRLLFKPSASVSIVGDNQYNSTDNTKTKKWHITATAPATAATYKVYKYNKANACLSEVARQNVYIGDGNIGDYLYADGTSGTETSGKAIVGIIFSDQLTENQYTASCKYGKALALNNANGGSECLWANDNNSPYTDQTVHPYCQDIKTCFDDVSSGYDAPSSFATSSNPAWYYCYTYKDGATHSGSLTDRNWYLPSIGEWWDVMENLGTWTDAQKTTIKSMRTSATVFDDGLIYDLPNTYFDGLNAKLTAASGTAIVPENDACYFWSASEYNETCAVHMDFRNIAVDVDYNGKTNTLVCVRAVLAY